MHVLLEKSGLLIKVFQQPTFPQPELKAQAQQCSSSKWSTFVTEQKIFSKDQLLNVNINHTSSSKICHIS